MLFVSLDEYRRLTPEERRHWNVGIDLTRGGDWSALIDTELDTAEYTEEMSIGGKTYRTR